MKERQFKETHGGPEYGKRGQEFSKGAETNARPQGNFGGKEMDQSPSAPSAHAKKSSFADRAKRLLIGVAGAAVLVVAVVLPARGPKADFVRVEATDTAIYYEIEVPETETGAVLVASSVDLLFIAKCREEDIFQVQRDMNRELKLLFDANDIGIPFPQVVVNQPATFNARTTKRMETGARDFLEEQKEQSKGMEEEDL
ncbi:MAG TPA: hypothetical protein H9737_01185 [Candidatus Borkfalkia faecigallinarum]|uniref:Uncharacterized protein n=1 Tax=Candidatus Borkfalkia faecigallinarum TaxID=2838509 RepID=A0A9D1VTG9_9FIRM|nr:hypothetical protein [Candidatus Borkfalkia faecigallinarum]